MKKARELLKRTTVLISKKYKTSFIRTTSVPKDVIEFMGATHGDKIEWYCMSDNTVVLKIKRGE